jgi:hypothetical protein
MRRPDTIRRSLLGGGLWGGTLGALGWLSGTGLARA